MFRNRQVQLGGQQREAITPNGGLALAHDPAMVVDRLAELQEWDKLAQQERRGWFPSGSQFRDHNRPDLPSKHVTSGFHAR